MAVMLLEWVFTSAFLILVVLALRAALGKRMSAGLRYALWAVVLVRLLVPVQLFTSPIAGTRVFSGQNTEQNIYKVTDDGLEPGGPGDILSLGGQDGPSVTFSNFPLAPDAPTVPDAPEPPAAPDLTKLSPWLGWIWLAGSAAVFFVLLLSNLRFFWKLCRERVPLDTADLPLRVYVAAGLPSPCLFGILRPAIYVTPEAAADPDMLRHVLAHEHTHYRHGDHIWSLLRCAALAVHWWNPLVWLAAVLSQRDAELACDEGALKRLGDGERAGYGNTLLALVTAKPKPGDLLRCATTMAGDKKSLKERVSRIACAPKRILWAAVAAVLVTALACVCAFGQAAEEAEDGPEPSSEVASQTVVPAYDYTAPEQVQTDAEEFVRERFESLRDKGILYGIDGTAGIVADPPELDGWRIERLTGPYWSGQAYWDLLGINRRVELWNVVYAYHSTTPNKAWNLANGATELTEDGWLTPINYGAEYLVYELGEDGSRTLLTAFGEQGEVSSMAFRRNLRVELSRGGIPENMGDAYFAEEYAEYPLSDLGRELDLNRNGVPETLQAVDINDGAGQRLEVWENGQLLFSEEGYHAHAGFNALFLCTLDGEDYLLRYNPYMGQGWCTYSYQLFTLENDRETVVLENNLEFDINFHPLQHQSFDPEAIANYVGDVNSLLTHSVQLINTDWYLLDTFEKEGRLVDNLWWLDSWEPIFVRDDSKSLLENLRDFQAAMENQWYAEEPVLLHMNETEENAHILLRYQDKSTQFDADYWEVHFQPPEQVQEQTQVIDLNGDGREEIVFPLVWGHGTGCYVERLYIFDAETLEQYDTSGLEDMILSQVTSYADEDRFYVSAPGLEAEIEKPDVDYIYNDSVCFGDYYCFRVENGRLYGRFGAALDRGDLCYCGTLKVELRLDGGKLVCAGFEYLTEDC